MHHRPALPPYKLNLRFAALTTISAILFVGCGGRDTPEQPFGLDGSLLGSLDGGRGDASLQRPDAEGFGDGGRRHDGAVPPEDGSVDWPDVGLPIVDAGAGPVEDGGWLGDGGRSRDGGARGDGGPPPWDGGGGWGDGGSPSWDGGWGDVGYPPWDGGGGWGDGGYPPWDGGGGWGDGGAWGSCGNGRVESGEYCDDGNNVDGDGCAAYCWIELGYKCTGSPSSCAPAAHLGALQPGACLQHQGGAMAAGAFDTLLVTLSQDAMVHGSLVSTDGDLDLYIEHLGYSSYVYSQGPGDEYFQHQWMAAGDHAIIIASWWASGPVSSYSLELCAEVFQGWSCDPLHYGSQDGCDCGCGLVDPDCYGPQVQFCDYCDTYGSCNGFGGCPGNIDPANNATCL